MKKKIDKRKIKYYMDFNYIRSYLEYKGKIYYRCFFCRQGIYLLNKVDGTITAGKVHTKNCKLRRIEKKDKKIFEDMEIIEDIEKKEDIEKIDFFSDSPFLLSNETQLMQEYDILGGNFPNETMDETFYNNSIPFFNYNWHDIDFFNDFPDY